MLLSNWVILLFSHFAFLFILTHNKKKEGLGSVSILLLILYFCQITLSLILYFFDFRVLFSTLISSSIYIVFYILSRNSFSTFKFHNLKLSNIFITIACAVGYAFLVVNSLNSKSFIELSDLYIVNNGHMYAVLFYCILPAIFEEVIFRVVILNKLLISYSKINAVMISSFFFGLIHLINYPLISFSYLFLMGLTLGLIKIKWKNINYCIIFHFIYNLMVIMIF
jgi:membrane protease YdiL (CAAX protease family)